MMAVAVVKSQIFEWNSFLIICGNINMGVTWKATSDLCSNISPDVTIYHQKTDFRVQKHKYLGQIFD